MESIYLFYILLPLVAFLYASVGHGGVSGYLALMAIFGISITIMKPTALILNLFVAGVSFVQICDKQYSFVCKLPLRLDLLLEGKKRTLTLIKAITN